jgi:hypothetical protein
MNLQQIQEQIYNEILDLRSLEHLIKSKLFRAAWDSTTEEQHNLVLIYIKDKQCPFIKTWIRKHNQNTLTTRELKEIAYQLGIYRYSRLSKNELLQAIMEHENGTATGSTSNGDSSQSRSPTPDAGETLQI